MPFPVSWFSRISFGRRSEIDGADYLRGLGFRVVASQYRIPAGEVDLIAWEGDVLVFVEVKARLRMFHRKMPSDGANNSV
jgi:putative endonuclease